MQITQRSLRTIITFVAIVSLITLLIPTPPVAAQASPTVRTWDGGGADDNFSTAANWVSDVAPSNGEAIEIGYDVVFSGDCSSDVTLNNDLDAGTVTIAGITMTGSRPTDCYKNIIISGNDLNLSGDVLGNSDSSSWPQLNFSNNLVATTALKLQAVDANADLSIGANAVDLKDSSVAGGISGSAELTLSGLPAQGGSGGCSPTPTPGPVQGDSSGFSGSIVIAENGSMSATGMSTELSEQASAITLDGGFIAFSMAKGDDFTYGKNITSNGGTIYATQINCSSDEVAHSTTTLSGDITLNQETTFAAHRTDVNLTGSVTGEEHITVSSYSTGKVTVGDNTYNPEKITTEYKDDSPTTTINVSRNETAVVTGTYSNVWISDGGVLKGDGGTVGDVTVYTGGTLAPGMSPGCLSTGDLSFDSGSTYDYEIAGTEACTEHDQTQVTGTVTIDTAAVLNSSFLNDFVPAQDDSFVIIDNDDTEDITGNFQGLENGDTFDVDGVTFRINYDGGDGNDVELTAVNVPEGAGTGIFPNDLNPAIPAAGTILILGALYMQRRRQLSA